MINPKDLRAGNTISIPNCGIHATVKRVYENDVQVEMGDYFDDPCQTYFNIQDIFGIMMHSSLLPKIGYSKDGIFHAFKKGKSIYNNYPAYVIGDYNKDLIWSANEIYIYDGNYYLSVSKQIEWPYSPQPLCVFLHQLQNIFWFLRGVDLIYKPDFNPNDI